MKYTYIYIIALILVLAGCQRRPLTEADYAVQLNITLNKDIVNHTVEKDPSLMRCIFFDSENGAFVTQAFLPPEGGIVNLIPSRTYNVLVYNFDTESTWIKEENWFHKIYASTSLIPDSFKTKLRSRSTKVDEEMIVYDPDHLFVGRLNNVFIPARSVEAEMVVLNVEAKSVVQSWKIELSKVTGTENIGSIAGVITSLTQKSYIGLGELSEDYISVYFDNTAVDEEGFLTAGFNTFGRNPQCIEPQILSLVFIDVAGKGKTYNFDVTKQMTDNPEQIIRLETEIDIPKPMTDGNGGFVPKVDEWEDINTDIII